MLDDAQIIRVIENKEPSTRYSIVSMDTRTTVEACFTGLAKPDLESRDRGHTILRLLSLGKELQVMSDFKGALALFNGAVG